MTTAHPFAVALAMALAVTPLLSACSFHATHSPLPGAIAPVAHSVATVTIRLGGAFSTAKSSAGRATLGFGANATGFSQLDVVKARLKVSGPGLAAQTLAEAAWAPAQGASGMPATLRADAPVGPNRIFTVEGLNADGQVVMRLRGAATVAASGNTAVTINFLTDAAARVLEAMLNEAPTTTLLDVDRTAAIQQFLTAVCRFDSATNTYDGTRLPPQELLVKRLASKLLTTPDLHAEAADPVAAFFDANPVNTESDSAFVESMKGGHCAATPSRIQFYVAGSGGGPVIPGIHFLPYPGTHFSQFRVILIAPQNGTWRHIALDGGSAGQFGELTLPQLPPGVFSVALIRKAVGETPEAFISLTTFDTLEVVPETCDG